jgi:hypothetical protein
MCIVPTNLLFESVRIWFRGTPTVEAVADATALFYLPIWIQENALLLPTPELLIFDTNVVYVGANALSVITLAAACDIATTLYADETVIFKRVLITFPVFHCCCKPHCVNFQYKAR